MGRQEFKKWKEAPEEGQAEGGAEPAEGGWEAEEDLLIQNTADKGQ